MGLADHRRLCNLGIGDEGILDLGGEHVETRHDYEVALAVD
jgi:hypothetical protein